MEAKNSKFDFDSFGGNGYHHFAVNSGKHTKEEAIETYRKERYNSSPCMVEKSHVKWGAGVDEDGEPCVGWWFDYSPSEKRSVEVWAFRYDKRKIDKIDTGCCGDNCPYLDLKRSWCDQFMQELYGSQEKTRCAICHSTEKITFAI